MWWQEPVTRLKGIGPKKALEFENINVVTIGDLLNHFPGRDAIWIIPISGPSVS